MFRADFFLSIFVGNLKYLDLDWDVIDLDWTE